MQTRLSVLGTGAALPGAAITTADLVNRTAEYLPAEAPALALRIGRRLGIESRHFVRSFDAPQEVPRAIDTAPKLAARALRAALEGAACDVRHLGMLFGHTATPHTLLPGNVAWVADEIGYLGAHMELRQACTGFAAATVLSAALVASGVGPIAIVGSETGSVFLDPRHVAVDKTQLVNLLQMGDGAGAIILGAIDSATCARIELVFYGSLGGNRAPGIALDQGGSGEPQVNATCIPHFTHDFEAIRTHGVELLRASLRVAMQAGVAPESIDWWLAHPANGRMAEHVAKWLKLPADRVVCEASVLGNLGSAAIWVTLDRLRRSGRLTAGDRVMVLGAEASKYMFGGFLYIHGNFGGLDT
ncbi:MAG: 3-oxoacyl-[acyl-carrier-protein] synthase [Gammaproteobacteria bacterium]|jgi:3-oxoacyl-[acyl-carrier-protein] synthase-3|nr:3-oxoacyl-[acyl-carrier-protein] synthase [Gammaproteobacteria bacterium]